MSEREDEIAELSAAICDLIGKRLGKKFQGSTAILALEAAKQFFQMENILQYVMTDARLQAKIEVANKVTQETYDSLHTKEPE